MYMSMCCVLHIIFQTSKSKTAHSHIQNQTKKHTSEGHEHPDE